MTTRAVVVGCGHYLPKRVVENAEFEKTLDTNDEWIRSRSGIERRHFAGEDETTSSMATAAATAPARPATATSEPPGGIVSAGLLRRTNVTCWVLRTVQPTLPVSAARCPTRKHSMASR